MIEESVEEETLGIGLDEYNHITRSEYIYLGDYEDGELDKFMQDMNESRMVPRRTIYLNSNGGFLDFVYPIVDMLETSEVELVAANRIYSTAFLTFFAADVSKRILPGTIGLFHYPYRPHAKLKPNLKHDLGEDPLSKLESSIMIPYEDYFKELLNIDKKQHKKLLNGKELAFTYEEMLKLLEKSKKILAKYKK